MNIKLGVLTNNIRSYIDEHISNLQISTLSSSQQVQSSYSDEVSVEAMSIPEPPIQEDNPLPEVDVPSSNEHNETLQGNGTFNIPEIKCI